MRILDRYILKNILALFFTCLFTFLFLYIIIDVFSHLDDILRQKVHVQILLQYYLSYMPIIFVQVAPFSSLLAVLYTFGRLNRNNEVIVMRASGLSIFQITKTVLIFGIIISTMVFWVNDRLVPISASLTQRIKEQMESGSKRPIAKDQEVITNLYMYGMKNRLYSVNKFTVSTNTMEGITILEHDEKQNIIKKIVANKEVFKDNLWTFFQCITYDYDENGQTTTEPRFAEEELVNIPESPHDFLTQRQHAEYMTSRQIEDYMLKLSRSGATGVIRKLKVDFYQRFASPLTTFVMILLAIPFALMMKKRATGLSSLGLSIVMGFLYYVVNAVSIALGYAGVLMPAVAVSLSHIVVLCFSLYLINKLP